MIKVLMITFVCITIIVNYSFGQKITHHNYIESDSIIPNPERGFYHQLETTSSSYEMLDESELRAYRKEGITLILRIVMLDNFKNSDLSSALLDKMNTDFVTIRNAGIKAVLLFSYTNRDVSPYGDAPVDRILRHIQQMGPVFRANSDVIAAVQAGFIGAWGEWYYTDYFSRSPGNNSAEDWANRQKVVDALLNALPANRMVQVRTPYYKHHIINSTLPLAANEAFANTSRARIAHFNDCFLASSNDVGTYMDTAQEKRYLEQDTKFTVIGGETCGLSSFSECPNSVHEMQRMHWSFLNADYHGGVLGNWGTEGCMPQIQKQLGYRYYLKSADIQDSSKTGAEIDIKVSLFNKGFTNPYIPRKVEFVLRNRITNKVYYLDTKEELRFWNLNQDINLSFKAGLPPDMQEGDYDVFINLPDPETVLYGNPDYSIRLANTGLWEAATGYNSLSHKLVISKKASASIYSGNAYFQESEKKVINFSNIGMNGDISAWQNIDSLTSADSQDVNVLKGFNTSDSLFFLVTGNKIGNYSKFFIDADTSNSTGYNNPFWSKNGVDYMLQNGQLYYFSGPDNNTPGWTLIAPIALKKEEKYVEIGISKSKLTHITLHKVIRVGFENDTINGTTESTLPVQGSMLPLYNQFIIANPAKCSVYANNVLVYWAVNDSSYYQKIQRADESGQFNDIGFIQPGKIFYKDLNLNANGQYQYRVYMDEQNKTSISTNPVSVSIDSKGPYFTDIRVDGIMSDWNAIPPVAASIQNNTRTLRFMNTADSLYFLLEGFASLKSYSLFLDADYNDTTGINKNWASGGFDYKVDKDSLFEAVSGNFSFKTKIKEKVGEGCIEGALALSSIPKLVKYTPFKAGLETMDTNNNITWLPSKYAALCVLFEAPKVPSNFKADNSSLLPKSRIVLSWKYSTDYQGYIIERSMNDTLNFTTLVQLDGSTSKYWDDNLDSTKTYYYRLYSFNEVSRSGFTLIVGGKPGLVNDIITSNSILDFEIYPNPIIGQSVLKVITNPFERISIDIWDVNGRRLKTVFTGISSGNLMINVNKEELPSGVYFIQLKSNSKCQVKKFICE
jgi:hypothetical protein